MYSVHPEGSLRLEKRRNGIRNSSTSNSNKKNVRCDICGNYSITKLTCEQCKNNVCKECFKECCKQEKNCCVIM